MSCLKKLNQLLKSQSFNGGTIDVSQLLDYAKNISQIENVTVVVSDMRCGISRIFPGKFGIVLGVSNYVEENSIWEKAILNLMTESNVRKSILPNFGFSTSCVMSHAMPVLTIILYQNCE